MCSRGERVVSWQRGFRTFLLFSSRVGKQSQPKSLQALYPLAQRAARPQSRARGQVHHWASTHLPQEPLVQYIAPRSLGFQGSCPEEMKTYMDAKKKCIWMFDSSIIRSWQNMETTQMFINNVVCWCNIILFSHKREWSNDTCYNMDETENNIPSERSQIQKMSHITDFIHMKYPE